MKRRNFIEREVFEELIREVPRADGGTYEDIETIYTDMSRLVVGWLANSNPKEICEIYNRVSWGGTANGRALHEAAKTWMARYRPEGVKKNT